MKTYPLTSIDVPSAQNKQFKLIDCIAKQFQGHEILDRGDLGLYHGLNKPKTTHKVEKVLADFFNAEACILVRGSGTSAIRYALHACLKTNETLLVHTSPIYSTTKTSLEMLGIKIIQANFNKPEEIKKCLLEHSEIKAALVQLSRQSLDDYYDYEEVIQTIHQIRDIPVISDDNYVVMKVDKIGVEAGSDLSCFSTFKLLGPEGIGCIVGKKQYIDRIATMHYSGGSQTQGHEALDVLTGLIYAPVALAIQAQVNEECVRRLNQNEIKGIKNAFLANAQSKVLLVEFEEPIAKQVLIEAEKRGALPNPVGAESKYEFMPLFYRVSGTFLEKDPTLIDRMIRINPNRAGADTVLRILKDSMENS